MRYSAGIVDWTKAELDEVDRKTRKMMTMHGMLHPRSNVCRLYLPRAEGGRGLISVADTVSECKMMAQKEYKARHDKLAKVIHWDLCKKSGFRVGAKWYQHVPERVEENDRVKILWDFNIQTDHVIEHTVGDRILSSSTKRRRRVN